MSRQVHHINPVSEWKSVFFLGIGGIGMSALARYLKAQAISVCGFDRTPSQLTDELQQENIPVYFSDNPHIIPQTVDIVVYTPAIPEDSRLFQYVMNTGIPCIKRSVLLGMITNNNRLLAVAGTHGKTTVSTMLAHIMSFHKGGCNGILGGISINHHSNLLLAPGSNVFVTEADEFDRSFLALKPWLAIITSTDADHLDVYKDHYALIQAFAEFASQVREGGKLIIKAGLSLQFDAAKNVAVFNYALSENSDFYAQNIKLIGIFYRFDLVTPFGSLKDLKLGVSGLMNVENAVAASAAALLSGASKTTIRKGLATFRGVKRRFDQRIIRNDFVYIDDYAHHPQELNACITSIRKLYPHKEITGVFQPHLYTRTRDFADDFAASLEKLDRIILLDIYPARELPIPGVSSEMLLNKIKNVEKHLLSKDELVDALLAMKPQILLTLGAGDIDRMVEPIENAFKSSRSR
ncbi:MAG: UDP-N-acetylmuramate--L-alanine ligase [Bacteroidales bacterium]|nr:UDP-N-acetylmuramate--L-alanine ligase [Bacteroidales bacterium]